MTISKKRIGKAAQQYRCVFCQGAINPGDSYWSMFGMAERGDKPYTIRVCIGCEEHDQAKAEVGS